MVAGDNVKAAAMLMPKCPGAERLSHKSFNMASDDGITDFFTYGNAQPDFRCFAGQKISQKILVYIFFTRARLLKFCRFKQFIAFFKFVVEQS